MARLVYVPLILAAAALLAYGSAADGFRYRGIYPDAVTGVIKQFEKEGRTVPMSQAVNRNRAKFGLPPLSPVPMDEIHKILEPDDENGGEG